MKYVASTFISMLIAGNAFAMAQPQGGAKGSGSIFGLMLPMVIVFAIFYLLLIRPQQKQQKKMKAMLASVERDDEVITRGGIHGKVAGIAEGIITLEIAQNVKIKINREYIATVKGKEPTKK